MEAEAKASGGFIRSTATDVLVASHGKGQQRQRMRVASQLWKAGVAVSHRTVIACSFCRQLPPSTAMLQRGRRSATSMLVATLQPASHM